jgi:hypothetical protein
MALGLRRISLAERSRSGFAFLVLVTFQVLSLYLSSGIAVDGS